LFFGLVLLAIGLVWAGFDWPLGWFCHTDLATLIEREGRCVAVYLDSSRSFESEGCYGNDKP